MKKALAILAVVAACAAAAWWFVGAGVQPQVGAGVQSQEREGFSRAGGPRDPRPEGMPAPPTTPLDARLTVVPGDDTVPHVAFVRIFNADARQDALLRRARPAATPGQAPPPVSLDLSVAAVQPVLRVARVADDGTEAPVPGDAVRVVRAPAAGASVLDADTTVEVVFELSPATVPHGATMRAYVDVPAHPLRTNDSTIDTLPADAEGRLAARGYAQQARGDWAGLLPTADALIAASPASAEGYWLRGVSLENSGDRAAALTAYRAAADRVTPGQEPPVGLYKRIRALAP